MLKSYSYILLSALSFVAFSCDKDPDEPQNQLPVADAGSAQYITLPKNSVTLTGSGTDADGEIVGYNWSVVDGPSVAAIEKSSSPSTLVTNMVTGKYIFQLMVTDDKGGSATDTVSVSVIPATLQTLTLQPENNPDEFQVVNLNGKDASGANVELSIAAWTKDSKPYILRELIKFDLSSIPSNATIKSANLFLYSTPTPLTGNFTDANHGTDNSLLFQQVTTDWDSNVGWFSQPTTTTTNQVIIPSTTQKFLDLNLDIAPMIQSMISTNKNYGFMLQLQKETIYSSRIFVSSNNNIYPDKRPKLVVVYQ